MPARRDGVSGNVERTGRARFVDGASSWRACVGRTERCGRGGHVRRAVARGDARRRITRVLGCRHQLAPIAAGGQRAAPRFCVGRSGAVRGPCAKRLCVTIEIDAVRRRCDVLLASGVSKSGFETEVRVRLIRGNKLPSPCATCRLLPFPPFKKPLLVALYSS